jgi:hypothetical protein
MALPVVRKLMGVSLKSDGDSSSRNRVCMSHRKNMVLPCPSIFKALVAMIAGNKTCGSVEASTGQIGYDDAVGINWWKVHTRPVTPEHKVQWNYINMYGR